MRKKIITEKFYIVLQVSTLFHNLKMTKENIGGFQMILEVIINVINPKIHSIAG